ncbi:hypothetical protein FOZ62_018739, partial [Perkinsus olseni]
VKIKVYIVEKLIPHLIIGVSGLRLLRVGLMFSPEGIEGYSGLAPPERERTEDHHVISNYMAELDGANVTAAHEGNVYHNDDLTCLFDAVNFIGIQENPTDDYTQDLLVPAHVSVQVHHQPATSSANNVLKKGEGLLLEQVLEHPLGTFRGLIVDHKDSDEAGTSYRALHDFNWTTRPAPSEGNKTAAERQARKLFNTLTKKGAQKAYTE